MSWLTNIEAVIQKDEQWVVQEIRKGWALVQNAEHQAEIDVLNIFHWISANQANIQNLVHTVLTDITAGAAIVGAVVPGSGTAIAATVGTVTTTLNAGMVAINKLAQGIQRGSTPMSTVANAFQATKDAASAANAFLKQATAQPAPTTP